MSTINTNGIDVNYPTPGVNNNSQGFRDNFSAIKTSLNTAGTELSDLQSKVVVKTALANATVDNNMGNTLISNAAIRGFRATTFNLGNALSGTVLIDVSRGDVQSGTIAGNVVFQFGSWAPTGTQSNLQLKLTSSNSLATISWPSAIVQANNNFGVTTLENYSNVANVPTTTFPYNVTETDYRLSTIDCGNTITIEPFNRPRVGTQIQQRLVPSTGFQGDVAGKTAVDPTINQLKLTSSNASDYFTTTGNTSQLYVNQPVVFTGTSFEANITPGTTYYVNWLASASGTNVAVSSTLTGANVNLAGSTGNMYLNPIRYTYVCTDEYDSTLYSKTATTTIATGPLTSVIIANTSGGFTCAASPGPIEVGQTLVISGTFGGSGTIATPAYSNPTTYYIIATNGSTDFVLSTTRGGANVITTTGTPTGVTYTLQVNQITLNNITSLVVNSPIIFSGTLFGGLAANTVYYIKNIATPNITVALSRTNGVADSSLILSNASGTCTAEIYVGSDIWKRTALTPW